MSVTNRRTLDCRHDFRRMHLFASRACVWSRTNVRGQHWQTHIELTSKGGKKERFGERSRELIEINVEEKIVGTNEVDIEMEASAFNFFICFESRGKVPCLACGRYVDCTLTNLPAPSVLLSTLTRFVQLVHREQTKVNLVNLVSVLEVLTIGLEA